jgi:hypothetical protein
LTSCCKDDILQKGEANVFPSYSSSQVTMIADFQGEDEISLLRISRVNQNGLIERIIIKNVPLKEETFRVFTKMFIPGDVDTGVVATFLIMPDEDAVGEKYEIDSTLSQKSTIEINDISNKCISGSFNLHFKWKNDGGIKLEPSIPDSFYIEGNFNAEKFK